jgi:Fe-S-cluster-containing dehydrogenase component
VNQQKCIGCKACVVACPFGTMEIIVTPLDNGSVKASANKCDLCLTRPHGPACIENCPADVLSLATPAVLDNLAKSRRQRTACLEAQPWHAEAVREDAAHQTAADANDRHAASPTSWLPQSAWAILTKFTCRSGPNRPPARRRAA